VENTKKAAVHYFLPSTTRQSSVWLVPRLWLRSGIQRQVLLSNVYKRPVKTTTRRLFPSGWCFVLGFGCCCSSEKSHTSVDLFHLKDCRGCDISLLESLDSYPTCLWEFLVLLQLRVNSLPPLVSKSGSLLTKTRKSREIR
jgi:hypothetical protein